MNLSQLRALYRRPGPWASVYVDVSRDTPDAGKKTVDLAARAVAGELAAADPDTRAAVEAAVRGDSTAGRHGVAIFATAGEVVLTAVLPQPPPLPVVHWAARPRLLPLLAGAREQVRWLRILADRTGADLVLDSGELLRSVTGSQQYPIRKAHPGGWSQRRYQQAAEETWEHTAKEVAEAVVHAVEETGAEVVILAGDVRARQLLAEHLPPLVTDRLVETDAGQRAAGADPAPLDDAVQAAVRDLVGRRHEAVLDRYRAGLSDGLAVTGRAAVRHALEWAQVDTVLLDVDSATGKGEVEVEGLVEAAAGTDAELVVVGAGEGLSEGIGAVLRYRVGPAPEGESSGS